MDNRNIWTYLNFSESKAESAYDLLLTQTDQLAQATNKELEMEIEVIDSFLESEPIKPVALYIVYVVAPKLGNFRRKILTVVEDKEAGRFPVEIFCHIDDKKEDKRVYKEDFLDKIASILSRPSVKISIENLYRQSREYSKKKSA